MKILSDQNHPILAINAVKGLKIILVENIVFIKAFNKGSIIYLNNSEIIETKEILKNYSNNLPLPWFFRCHNSFMVNCRFVDCFSGNQVILKDNRRFPLSRRKKELFKKNLIKYTQSLLLNHYSGELKNE